MVICFFHVLVVIWFGLGLCCLTPLLTIFQLWGSVLLVEETGVPRKNHRPVASHWQPSSHNVVSSTPRLSGVRTENVSGDRHWCDLVSWTFTPYLSIFRIISYSWSGADPGFQVRGGAHLKKMAPRGGRHENIWGISCEKSRFYDKKIIFFPILRGAPLQWACISAAGYHWIDLLPSGEVLYKCDQLSSCSLVA